MDEHTVLEHLGNLGVILLAVLLSTSLHYLFLRHLNRGARLALKFPQIRLGYGVIVSLIAHSIEVALFALAYKVSISSGFVSPKIDFISKGSPFIKIIYLMLFIPVIYFCESKLKMQ